MAGIGDAWGTKEELLHPRGPDGRWIRKAGVAKSIIGAVLDFLQNFRPRSFQNKQQSTQYLHNIAHRGGRPMGRVDHVRLRTDLGHANADLRDGVIDEPSTKTFVDMMDRHATELPDDVILTRVVGVESFGFTPETATGTDADNPGIRGLSGKLVADRGYSLTTIGGVQGQPPQGSVRMVVAAKKGTKVIVPGASQSDPTIFMDRGQPLRVTKVTPDGAGGWTMYVTAEPHKGKDVPEPIAGPVGEGRKPSAEREAEIKQQFKRSTEITSRAQKVPDEQKELADEQRRRQAAEEAKQTPRVLSPREETEKKLIEQRLEQQRAATPVEPPPGRQTRPSPPGTPPARQEPIHARSIGGGPRPEAGAPEAGAPGTPETAPQVDLRRAVQEANIKAPEAGKKRKQFNDVYEGVISGKKDPGDAVRELDRDAADLDAVGDGDAQSFRDLADVIRREHGLEQPAPAPAKKVAKKAAPNQFTPEQEQALVDRAKQFRGAERNEEERRIVRQADEILARRRGEATPEGQATKALRAPAKKALPPVKKAAPAKVAPAKALTPQQQLEQDIKGLFNGRRPTNAQLRQMGEENNLGFGPKEPRSEMIRAILGARPARGRQRGEMSPDEVKATEALRRHAEGTQAKQVESIRARRKPEEKSAPNVNEPPTERAAPAKRVAKKAAPEAPGGDLDKMTKKELLDEAERRGVHDVPKSWTKDKIKAHLRDEEVRTPRKKTPEQRKAQDRVDQALHQEMTRALAREAAGNPDTVRRQLIATDPPDRHRYLEDLIEPLNVTETRRLARGLSVRGQDRNDKPHIIQAIVRHFEGVEAPERMPEGPGTAPVKKAAKAAVPGAAPGTAAGKITAGRLQPGMRILVTPQGNPTNRKTGQRTLTIESVDRVAPGRTEFGRQRQRPRIRIIGRDEDGNTIQVPGDATPSQTFIVAPEAGAPTKVTKKAAPKRMTIGEARRLSAVEAIRQNEVTGNESNSWKTIYSRVSDGTWTVPRARKEAKGSARYWREQAATVRRGGGRFNPEKVEEAASRLERAADKYDKLAEDLTISQSVTKTDKFMQAPGAPDLEEAARTRQVRLDRKRGYGNLTTEIDELLSNDASPRALASRIRTRGKVQESSFGGPENSTIDAADIEALAQAAEAGDNNRVRTLAQELAQREGIRPLGKAGDVVPFNPQEHELLGKQDLPEGTTHVFIHRPGYRVTEDGEDVLPEKSKVQPATPDEVRAFERGKKLVPEGSVAGDRTQTPIGNKPRKRSFDEAWDTAELDAEGSPGRSMKEIRDDVSSGKITPEEGIRRMEDEIAFNKEDLAEIDANLRQEDLSDAERAKLQENAAVLTNGIEAQEKASKFMRLYFKDEKPTVKEVQVSLDAEGMKALREATPESLREAARISGLEPPKGETKDEILQDLVRQVARQVAEKRGLVPKKAAAKKATKAVKKAAPSIPVEREKLDVRTIGAGIDFDESDKWTQDLLRDTQQALDGVTPLPRSMSHLGKDPTPAAIGRHLDDRVRSMQDHASIQYGRWTDSIDAGGGPPDEKELARRAARDAELERLRGNAAKVQELADRLKKTRRRPAKKAATPEVQAAEVRADGAEARLINDRLERVNAAKSRAEAERHLDGLTMPELRRIGESMGIKGRSKQDLRDKILDRFKPTEAVSAPDSNAEILARLEAGEVPMSREEADALLAPLDRKRLVEIAQSLSVPRASSLSKERLRLGIREGTVGRRLDSIAIRGFVGERPGEPGKALPLGRRASDAGIDPPIEYFSDVQSAVSRADQRLRNGDSHTDVARELRERAAQVAKADLVEEGRRFKVEHDPDSLRSLRKSNAEYLRRVATHVQQEGKGPRPEPPKPTKKAVPTREERIAAHPIKRGGLSLVRGEGGGRGTEGGTRPALKVVPPVKEAPVKAIKKVAPAKKTAPQGPKMSDKPIIKNTWGTPGGEVSFHADGAIGSGLRRMGDDQRLDVNGEPLANVLGKLATRAVRGEITQDQLIQELKRLGERLPAGSKARREVEGMVKELDAPKAKPLDLPDGTPGPVTQLMRELGDIPLVSGNRASGRRGDDYNEMTELQRIARESMDRYPEGEGAPEVRQMRIMRHMENEIRRRVLNHRHESQEGKFQIDQAVQRAMRELERMVEELRKART